jgi:hypothetical protein
MMNSILFGLFALQIKTTLATHGAFKSCYDCKISSPDNKMCNFGSFSGDPWLFACCPPDSTSKYCVPSDFNECFPSYNEIKERYYTYCPLINSTMCGTEELDNSLVTKTEA